MSTRPKVPEHIQTAVLLKSRRRCALCYGIDFDLSEKPGQIAHLDQDPTNNAEENLAWLCLPHHDRYDSRTSVSKGITQPEVVAHRERLHRAVETGLAPLMAKIDTLEKQKRRDKHDRRLFRRLDAIMPEQALQELLRWLWNDDSHTRGMIRPIDGFLRSRSEGGNRFISSEVESACEELTKSLDDMTQWLSLNFFIHPDILDGPDTRFCLYPDLNVDRGGSGEREESLRYERHQTALYEKVAAVREAYRAFRYQVKMVVAL